MTDNIDRLYESCNTSGHCRRESDLMAFLAEQYKQIMPLYPDGVGETKNEFLESLWDVISTHFAGARQ